MIAPTLSLALGITFQTTDEAFHGRPPGIKLHQFFVNRLNVTWESLEPQISIHNRSFVPKVLELNNTPICVLATQPLLRGYELLNGVFTPAKTRRSDRRR